MHDIDFALKEKLSYFFSWSCVSEEFVSQWEYLNSEAAAQQGQTIWETSFKDVQLLSVPGQSDGTFRIAFKTYREKRFFRYFMRPSLAAREAKGFAVAQKVGIPCVKVLAFGEHRTFSYLKDAFFITAFEEGTQTFEVFAKEPAGREKLPVLLKETIARLGKLHAAGWCHGGAHPRNFIWKENAEGKLESIWLDLASFRPFPRSGKKWKYLLADLSDLTEVFKLTREELDMLMEEYRRFNDVPVTYELRTDHPYKFSKARRLES